MGRQTGHVGHLRVIDRARSGRRGVKAAVGTVLTVGVVLALATASFAYQLSMSGSMEGDLQFIAGSWVAAGYHFSEGRPGWTSTSITHR